MKQLFIAAFAGLISLGAQAQVTESRTPKDATALEVKDGIEVVFTQSDTLGLNVTADSRENLKKIATDFKNGTLTIYLKDGDNAAAAATVAKVYVSQKNVTRFTASKGANIRVNGRLNLKDLSVNLSSGATLNAMINTSGNCNIDVKSGAGFRGVVTSKDFSANIISGGYIKVGGSTNTANVYCSGGSLNAGKLLCGEAKVWAQKASSVSIYTIDAIKTNVDASSAVTYYGEPSKASLGSNVNAVKRDNYKLTLN
jgi:hypothetical protein